MRPRGDLTEMTLQAETPEQSAAPLPAGPAAERKRRESALRWPVALAYILAATIFLFLAFAPFGQFYLAWVALVPWLIAVARAGSLRAASLWGWVGGAAFFGAQFSYVLLITVPGAIGLAVLGGLYWGFAAAMLRFSGLLDLSPAKPSPVLLRAAAVASVWTAVEWVRSYALGAVPWLLLGHSQTPFLPLCQVADLTGVYGISFIVAFVNALLALTVLARSARRSTWPAWIGAAALLFAVVGYGIFRLSQQTTTAGPTVLVVQPNDWNFHDKTTLNRQHDYLDFHLQQTRAALGSRPVDLVVWSETTMPSLNPEPRERLRGRPLGEFLEHAHRSISELAIEHNTAVVAGGYFVGYDTASGKAGDYRNSAYFYDRSGEQAGRYDKIHLVPFGEFTPWRELPFVRRIVGLLGRSDEYALVAGTVQDATSFTLASASTVAARFITPICFEDLDAWLIARQFRGLNQNPGGKRADFIVNLTNDGWFRWSEQKQHLQAAIFRSIENRAPTARAVNTGVSGFIDSVGRTHGLLPLGVEGTSTAQLMLDRRVTFYTRFGDVFAYATIAASAAMILRGLMRWRSCRSAT